VYDTTDPFSLPGINPRITPGGRGRMHETGPGEGTYMDPDPIPDPFGTDLFKRVQADPKGMEFLNGFKDTKLAAGYSPLIPSSLQEKYKRDADIDKYLKNIERLRKKGIV
tara:strand:- start:834 stop:1163 length:330 start_codon:yes stop_codon:yes gene_type:complete